MLQHGPMPATSLGHVQDSELCLISAETREGLIARITGLREYVNRCPSASLLDVAYTLSLTWRPEMITLAVVAATTGDLVSKLDIALGLLADPDRRRIRHRKGIFFFAGEARIEGRLAFLFPGEGSQYVNMMRELCIRFPAARHGFDLVDRACAMNDDGFVPSQVIFPPPGATDSPGDGLWGMVAAIEAVSAAGAAFRLVFEQLKLIPDAVVGHSSGEFLALETAGILRLVDDKERTAFIHEGYVQLTRMLARDVTREGVLLAVGGVDRSVIDDLLAQHPDRILVAIENCPHQYVLCAEPDLAEAATRFLAGKRGIVETLPFRRPYHTPWFDDTLDGLRNLFQAYPLHPPRIDIYSCASARRFPEDLETIGDLCVTQWARPVAFRQTIEQMYEDGIRVFLEVGPRGNLTSFVSDILADRPHVAVAPDRPSRPGLAAFHEALAELAAQGLSMDLGALFERRRPSQVAWDAEGDSPASPGGMIMQLSPALLPVMSAKSLPPRSPSPEGTGSAGHPDVVAPPAPLQDPVVQAYFDTMESFLTSQRQVMDQFFQGASSPSTGGEPAPAESIESDYGFPMLGRIETHEPGKSLAAVQRFSLAEFPFLGEHAFPGTSVSFDDPSLLGLPIMPLTFSLELIAEAASALVPGKVVVGMKEIRATRWVSFTESDRALRVTARVVASGDEWAVRAELRDAEGGKGKFKIQPTLVEATVLLAADYPTQVDPTPHRLADEKSCQWTSDTIYPDNLFHGPMLQGIRDMTRWGRDGMEGSVEVLGKELLFRSTPTPRLAIDPILLDSLGAMLYIWLDCEGPWRQRGVVLPFRAVEFRFNTPLLEPGTRLRVKLTVVSQTEMSAAADIRAIDDQGRVVMDTLSWEGRTFDLGPALHGVFHTPTRHHLSDTVTTSTLSVLAGETGSVHILDSLTMEFLTSSHGVWQTTIAYSIFDRAAREHWKGLRGSEEDRVRWLLERAAAKDAVRHHLRSSFQREVASPDVHLEDVGPGILRARGTWLEEIGTSPEIVVASSGQVAVAALVPAGGGVWRLAVDAVAPSPGEQEATFSPEERSRFVALFQSDPPGWQRLWSAKLAAAASDSEAAKTWRLETIDADTDVVSLRSADGQAVATAGIVIRGDATVALALISPSGESG